MATATPTALWSCMSVLRAIEQAVEQAVEQAAELHRLAGNIGRRSLPARPARRQATTPRPQLRHLRVFDMRQHNRFVDRRALSVLRRRLTAHMVPDRSPGHGELNRAEQIENMERSVTSNRSRAWSARLRQSVLGHPSLAGSRELWDPMLTPGCQAFAVLVTRCRYTWTWTETA